MNCVPVQNIPRHVYECFAYFVIHVYIEMKLLLINLTFIIYACNAAKILGIFPLPARSHFNFNNAVMKSLIEAGHQVTVITPFFKRASLENYTSIIDTSKDEFIYVSQSSFNEFAKKSTHELLDWVAKMEKSYCDIIINLPEVRKILDSDEKLYDVLFVELLFVYKCFLPIAEKMRIPVIGTVTMKSWVNADRAVSNPNHPAYVPFELSNSWRSNDFYARLHNLWNFVVTEWYWYFVNIPVLRQFHKENVDLIGPKGKYLDIEPEILFYNNHPIFLPRPMNPNVVEIGGIHVIDAKPLPKNVQKFIDEAKHGVILFSLGSIVRAAKLPIETQMAFKDAFAEIPQRVIWKFEEDMENLPDNVMLMEWVLQRDILEHKNVIAFISHCGQGGTYEAIYTATPIISCPLFADQISNAVILEDLEVAIHLDINNISKEIVLNVLNAIVNDTRYLSNMQTLSEAFKDRPMTPQQSVVYWTEYVIRHKGASYLKTAANSLNWAQYLFLDVFCYILLCFIAILYIIIYIVKAMYFNFYELKKKFPKDYKNKDL